MRLYSVPVTHHLQGRRGTPMRGVTTTAYKRDVQPFTRLTGQYSYNLITFETVIITFNKL